MYYLHVVIGFSVGQLFQEPRRYRDATCEFLANPKQLPTLKACVIGYVLMTLFEPVSYHSVMCELLYYLDVVTSLQSLSQFGVTVIFVELTIYQTIRPPLIWRISLGFLKDSIPMEFFLSYTFDSKDGFQEWRSVFSREKKHELQPHFKFPSLQSNMQL